MYHDASEKLICPSCKDKDFLFYTAIPNNARLVYDTKVCDDDAEDSNVTEHLGGVRDYTCKNCGFLFFVTIHAISCL